MTAPIPAGASPSHTLPFPGEAFQFITECIKQASSGLFLEADCHALSYCSTLLSLFQFPYVCRSVSPYGALPALCFHAEYNSEFKVYSLGVDEHAGTGYSFAFVGKNLQTSLPCGRSACIFSRQVRNTPLFPACRCVNERTNFKLRLYALKKYRLMTLNDRHIKITSFTPSPAHTALKKAAKVAGIALGLIVGVLLWAVLKPICRGVGG